MHQRGGQRHPLELATGQGVGAPIEQALDAQRQRHLLHPARHRVGALAPVLERQRDLGPHPAQHHLALGVLHHHAAHARQLGRPVLADAHARHLELPAASPPWKCGTSPHSARSSDDLPEPDSPASTVKLPGSSVRSMSRSVGREASA